MKRNARTPLLLIIILIVVSFLSSCSIFNKIPEKYTDGIKIDRDYPDDALLIYDDSIVFDSNSHFNQIVLSCGSQDDLDDIIEFYQEFFEDNDIVLDDEDEDRDEYYARGVNDGYLFKVEVVEAEGEYVEKLFENVIYLSVEELDESEKESLQATATPVKAESEETPAPDTSTEESPTNEKASNETPATDIAIGSWTLIDSSGDPGINSTDFNLEIIDDTYGILYYFNNETNINASAEFSYTINDGTLIMLQNNISELSFEAYYDDSILHLINIDVPTEEYYLVNFNDTYDIHPSNDIFTAYGSWIYYNPQTNYIDTISFWTYEDGYMYNIFGQYEEKPFGYEYADGDIVFWFDTEESFSLHAEHNGNILELTDQDGIIYPYNRVETTWLVGTYSQTSSSDEDIKDWIITFNTDHSASFSLITAGEKSNIPDSAWYINPKDGKLNIQNDGEFFGFYYHFNGTGLIIYDPDNDITIELIKTR